MSKIKWDQDWCFNHCPRLPKDCMSINNAVITDNGVAFGLAGHPVCVQIDFDASLTKTQKALIEYDFRREWVIDALEKWVDWERDCQPCPVYNEKLPKMGDTVYLF